MPLWRVNDDDDDGMAYVESASDVGDTSGAPLDSVGAIGYIYELQADELV